MDYKVDTSTPDYDHITLSSPSFISSSTIVSPQTVMPFVSLRCKPSLSTLPPELLSAVGCNLSLCEYSYFSRTCIRLHQHLFHPVELLHFLKTRYRLSVESGSIIIFAYLANMQVRAPLLLERIFEDFFADSPLRLQEEERWKLQCQQQRRLLNHHTFQLNQAITGGNSSVEAQRLESIQAHQAAEKARREAKWDAIRMLGVLYALDKTHVGPSSSTNALVLSGASDLVDQPPSPPPPTNNVVYPNSCGTAPHQRSSSSLLPQLAALTAPPQTCSTLESDDPITTSQHKGGQSRLQHIGSGSHLEADHRLCGFRSGRSLSQGRQDISDVFSHPRKSQRKKHSAFPGGKDTSVPSISESRRDSSSVIDARSQSTMQHGKQRKIAVRRPSRRLRPSQHREHNPVRDRALSEGQHSRHGSWFDDNVEMSREYSGPFSDDDDESEEDDEGLSVTEDPSMSKEPSSGLQYVQEIECNHGNSGASYISRSQSSPNACSSTGVSLPAIPSRPKPTFALGLGDEKQTVAVPDKTAESTQHQHILNRGDKIAFLTKYTDRMHLRLQTLGIKDWGSEDIQRKKTYQLMIQHNDKTGEKDLVNFYLGRYGGSPSVQHESQEQPPRQLQHYPSDAGIAPTFLASVI